MPSVFEGLEESKPLRLKLENVKTFASGAVLLCYKVAQPDILNG